VITSARIFTDKQELVFIKEVASSVQALIQRSWVGDNIRRAYSSIEETISKQFFIA
jgi:hypothetical protein